jgi:hypothetical protein
MSLDVIERTEAVAIADSTVAGVYARVREVEDALRRRARTARLAGRLMLFLMIFSIFAGLALFVFAGTITSREMEPAINVAHTTGSVVIQTGGPDGLKEKLAFASTATTRLGAVLLLLFLVQILLSIYKYTSRLSTFHSSRADGLSLLPASVPWAELTRFLSPDALDFGKSPLPLPAQLVSLTTEALKSVATKGS